MPTSFAGGKLDVRSMLYLVCLAMIGGGAILNLLRNEWLRIPYVPVVSLFEKPIAAFIHVLNLHYVVVQYGVVGMSQSMLSFAVSLAIVVLAVRRIRSMRQSRSILAPLSFSGFPYGLTWAAVALVPVWLVLQAMVFPVVGSNLVVVSAFLAFVLAELPHIRDSDKRATRRDNQGSVPAAAVPRSRPRWTFLSIAFPVLGAGLLVTAQFAFGGASLGSLALGFMALTVSCALGLVATVVAVARKERWVPAQVVGFLVNFGVVGALGLGLLAEIFRFG
jgi:hypothetical protein